MSQRALAQHFTCGLDTTQLSSLPIVAPEDFCFNTDYVIDGCVPLYLGVNLHFLLDDICSRNSVALDAGILATLPGGVLSTTGAIPVAQRLVDETNAYFAAISDNAPWNNSFHGVDDVGPSCIPIRLVLTGVYFHCSSSTQTINGSSEIGPLRVNPANELNYFIGNVSFATGFANQLGGTFGAQQTLSPGVFAHELMHMLDVDHTFFDDRCADTWPDVNLTWDHNNDGVIDQSVPRCWDNTPLPIQQGLDPCSSSDYAVTHPCCEWLNQNNNLMTYSAWAHNPDYGALTACQLERAVEHIAAHKCDYLLGVDGCPPVSAFVVTDPSVTCGGCIDMRASHNETFYELDIVNAQGALVHDGPTIQGTAGLYCIKPNIDKHGVASWPQGYTTGQTYSATLNTWNDCGQDASFAYTFELPEPCSITAEPAIVKVEAAINPPGHPGYVAVSIDAPNDGPHAIYGSHLTSGMDYGQLVYGEHEGDTVCERLIDVSSWASGVIAVAVQVKDEVHSFQFYKS